MRVYIQRDERRFTQDAEVLRERIDEGYFLLDNVEGFLKRSVPSGWEINIVQAPGHQGGRWVKLADGLDDETAQSAMNELLSLTGGPGDGIAVIQWDGQHFTRRIL